MRIFPLDKSDPFSDRKDTHADPDPQKCFLTKKVAPFGPTRNDIMDPKTYIDTWQCGEYTLFRTSLYNCSIMNIITDGKLFAIGMDVNSGFINIQ